MSERRGERSGLRVSGDLLVLTGLLLITGAILLLVYNMQESTRAAEASRTVMIKMAEQRAPLHLPEQTLPPMQGGFAWPDETPAPQETPVPPMPTVRIDGYDYIGSLTVPSLALELPVMAEWDYDRLRISPCLFSGSYFSNDLVICGHNYASHFSPLREIPIGEEILFIACDGTVYRYVVSNRETIQPYDVSAMTQHNTAGIGEGEWDLTLFTCNLGGQTRCAVRCVLDVSNIS